MNNACPPYCTASIQTHVHFHTEGEASVVILHLCGLQGSEASSQYGANLYCGSIGFVEKMSADKFQHATRLLWALSVFLLCAETEKEGSPSAGAARLNSKSYRETRHDTIKQSYTELILNLLPLHVDLKLTVASLLNNPIDPECLTFPC